MSYDTILFSVDGGIARLTLNRPDKLNSFNTQMHGEVRHALERLPGSGPGRSANRPGLMTWPGLMTGRRRPPG